jgi:hypothetical protein
LPPGTLRPGQHEAAEGVQDGEADAVAGRPAVQPGDGRGLTGFYLVVGWIVGGYLVAALLGVSGGVPPCAAGQRFDPALAPRSGRVRRLGAGRSLAAESRAVSALAVG